MLLQSDPSGFSTKLRYGDAKMNKSLVALALAGAFASAAQAQSIEMYGIVDMGFVQESGGPTGAIASPSIPKGTINKLTSGAQSGTRLGFKGTEDLGGGMKALFVLETGIAADKGGFNQGNLAFARQSFVGLQSDMGTVTMGRQYTPYFLTMLVGDPFAAGMAGAAQNMLMPGSNIRMDNAVKYTSPMFAGGFSGEAAYGFGEQADSLVRSRQLGAYINYSGAPVNVRLGYLRKNTDVSTSATKNDEISNWILAANWDIKVAKLFAAVTNNDEAIYTPIRPLRKSKDYLIGVQVPFNKHTFIASYIYKDGSEGMTGDANQLALGYTYTMSKRTNLYAAWGRINNGTNSFLTVGNNSEPGYGDKALNLGIRHIF
jgi:predicted porin